MNKRQEDLYYDTQKRLNNRNHKFVVSKYNAKFYTDCPICSLPSVTIKLWEYHSETISPTWHCKYMCHQPYDTNLSTLFALLGETLEDQEQYDYNEPSNFLDRSYHCRNKSLLELCKDEIPLYEWGMFTKLMKYESWKSNSDMKSFIYRLTFYEKIKNPVAMYIGASRQGTRLISHALSFFEDEGREGMNKNIRQFVDISTQEQLHLTTAKIICITSTNDSNLFSLEKYLIEKMCKNSKVPIWNIMHRTNKKPIEDIPSKIRELFYCDTNFF